MSKLEKMAEDDFLDFLTQYPVVKDSQIPMSFIRLCFFHGYNSSLKRLEELIDEKPTKN